jgi:hypothetical protein
MLALTYSRLEKEKKNPPVVETRRILLELLRFKVYFVLDSFQL